MNGGVSLLGTFASIVGGLVIGLATVLILPFSGEEEFFIEGWQWLCVSSLSGFLGSLLDSILGAWLQPTYFDQRLKKVYQTLTPSSSATAKENRRIKLGGLNVLANHEVKLIASTPILTDSQVNLLSSILVTVLVSFVFCALRH